MTFTFVRDADRAVSTSSDPAPTVTPDDDLRRRAAAILPKMLVYLNEHAPSHPGLAPAIAEMNTAIAAYQSFRTGDLQASLQRVLQAIEAQRRLDPSIPQP
jgi:hypothetical protein